MPCFTPLKHSNDSTLVCYLEGELLYPVGKTRYRTISSQPNPDSPHKNFILLNFVKNISKPERISYKTSFKNLLYNS